jgi:periplasmic protein TonB
MVVTVPFLQRVLRSMVHRVVVLVGALSLTLLMFLVLPVMETIGKPPVADLTLRSADTADVPPPPPPPEPEPEKEPEPEEKPPDLQEPAQPLDLSQLEVALNPGLSGDWLGGDFAVKLSTAAAASESSEALFSLADLDQKPRALSQPSPVMTPEIRRKAPGTVYILFLVGTDGRVENPMVQKSSDPIFEKAALAAIKQWKFEPGKRSGQPVRFRMRVPITFPEG